MYLSTSVKETDCPECGQRIPIKSYTLISRLRGGRVIRTCRACSIKDLEILKEALQARKIPRTLRIKAAVILKGKDLTGPCSNCEKEIQADHRCMHFRAKTSKEMYRGASRPNYMYCKTCSIEYVNELLEWLK